MTNFFDDGFDALEVWIGTDGRNGDLEHFVGQNLGDWFNLLNQGILRTGVADSDTHQRRTTQINARTCVASRGRPTPAAARRRGDNARRERRRRPRHRHERAVRHASTAQRRVDGPAGRPRRSARPR